MSSRAGVILPVARSATSSMFHPMSAWEGPELRTQRRRTDELPMSCEGKAYSTCCHEESDTAVVVDHTLIQSTPFVDTSIEAVSPVRKPSQRWKRSVREVAPAQWIAGVVVYLGARLFA